MSNADEAGHDWGRAGPRAWARALGVLDRAFDPALDALVLSASRATGVPVCLWFDQGDHWAAVAPSPATGPGTTSPDDSHATVDIDLRPVGVVARLSAHGALDARGRRHVDAVAAGVGHYLAARFERLRRDDQGGPIGMVLISPDTEIRWCSPEVDELVGGATAALGKPLAHVVPPDLRDLADHFIERSVAGRGATSVVPVTVEFEAGRRVPVDVQAHRYVDDPSIGGTAFLLRQAAPSDGEISIMGDQMVLLADLSANRPLEQTLGRVVDLLENHLPGSHTVISLLRGDGAIEPVHGPRVPAAVWQSLSTRMAGSPHAGAPVVLRTDMADFVPDLATAPGWQPHRPALDAAGYRSCWATPLNSFSGGGVIGAVEVFRSSVGQPSVRDTRVLRLGARLASIALDHDARTRELTWRANHDPLTLLPNRNLFAERLEEAAAEGDLSVIFLDLDRFKLVNDTLGHAFGDELLRLVGDRLLDSVPDSAVVARFGGDEFTVLLPKIADPEAAQEAAWLLLAELSEPYRIHDQIVSIGASAGVAIAEGQVQDAQALVRDADSALNHAKGSGRGRVELFDSDLLAEATTRVAVERALRDGLELGLVQVEFQPTIRLEDRSVVALEALARLRQADGRPISPAKFIPVAEETGLISRVFDVVFAEACGLAARWQRPGSKRVVWVNLAPQQLSDPDLVERIERALAETGAEAPQLGLEITEQGILPDPEFAVGRLGALADLGLHLAIDDFGAGNASLGYLQRLPVDVVKLDRSFVVSAAHNPRSQAIVRAMVDLTEALGLHCVAEGVETDEQLAAVAATGCQFAQGFLFARPAPLEALADLVDADR